MNPLKIMEFYHNANMIIEYKIRKLFLFYKKKNVVEFLTNMRKIYSQNNKVYYEY